MKKRNSYLVGASIGLWSGLSAVFVSYVFGLQTPFYQLIGLAVGISLFCLSYYFPYVLSFLPAVVLTVLGIYYIITSYKVELWDNLIWDPIAVGIGMAILSVVNQRYGTLSKPNTLA